MWPQEQFQKQTLSIVPLAEGMHHVKMTQGNLHSFHQEHNILTPAALKRILPRQTCDNLTIRSSWLNCLFYCNFFKEKASLIRTKKSTNSDHVPALFLLLLLDVVRGAVWPNDDDDDEPPVSSSAHKKNPQPLSLFAHL